MVSSCYDKNGDVWEYTLNTREAMEEVEEKVERAMLDTGTSRVIFAFSMHPNWRLQVLPSYKSNRKNSQKPPGLADLKHRVRERSGWSVSEKPGLEGDDILGILATHPTLIEGPKVVWSQDKDLRGVPCTLYPDLGGFITTITEEEADHWHLVQTLTGDATDGYKGCPGVGEVSAAKILGDPTKTGTGRSVPESPWRAVVGAYQKAGLTEEDALVQARVARILRWNEFNYETKEPILWQPKTK
jgi:DNA polymerase-1